ncbi:MAG: aminotransferase class V-fold PLP-dependent enzyme, partial [Parachlamydiales bacterium]
MTLDVKADFPLLQNYPDLIYFDSAATTQKPACVVQALVDFYHFSNANIHRGVYELSLKASELFEEARVKAARFINAGTAEEIIFTSGATDSLNQAAVFLGRSYFQDGDEIIFSQMEHHSNIVPWQMLALEKKLKLRVIPIDDKGELRL